MCGDFTLPSEADFGELQLLCPTYAICLADFVRATPEHDRYKVPFGPVHAPDEDAQPVAIATFDAFSATVAIVEYNYFDQDYRSEFGAVHENTFAAADPNTIRVHFFDGPQPKALAPMRDFIEKAKDRYRGYVVIRPQFPTSVGRSMVAPPRANGPLREGLSVADRIRTAVIEYVNLFGISLMVHGVPYMEQDSHLLRCAHVVTWMAHYTAVLKGLIARLPTGKLNSWGNPGPAVNRLYPNAGANDFELFDLLARVHLPPDRIPGSRFGAARPLEWFDNSTFRARVAELQKRPVNESNSDDGKKTGADALWTRYNLTSSICRYLNSGIPVIFNTGEHSVLICGYFRERDRYGGDPEVSAVAGFFAQDDQDGPFVELSVDQIVSDVMEVPGASLLVPLPVGLWLSGQTAEFAGAQLFRGLVLRALERLEEEAIEAGVGTGKHPNKSDGGAPAKRVSAAEVAAIKQLEAKLRRYQALSREVVDSDRPSKLTIRSYALEATDFKTDFASRVGDKSAAQLTGYVPMPKYVWVIEVLDRKRHRERKPPVVATIVLDASASSFDPLRPPLPMIAQIPGQISRLITHDGEPESWVPMSTRLYASGRWTGAPDGAHLTAAAHAHRAKSARA